MFTFDFSLRNIYYYLQMDKQIQRETNSKKVALDASLTIGMEREEISAV